MIAANCISLNSNDLRLLESFHKSWPLNAIPDIVKPYGELIRIHRPAGVMMFYFPCLYGTFLIGALGYNVSLIEMLSVNAKLLFLSFLLRGALVSYNDICDVDIDRQVERTRVRPLARGAISIPSAILLTIVQTVLLAAIAPQLMPSAALRTALPFLGFHLVYPFAKRLTHHPQLVLGFAHSLGVFVSFPALGQDIPLSQSSINTLSAVYLSAAIIFWTLLNDTIYAAQDVEYDRKAGIGSTMIFWERSIKMFLRALGVAQMVSLFALSACMRATAPTSGMVFNVLTCAGTLIGTVSMIEKVDLEDPGSCGWWFNRGNVILGCAIGSGLVGEYLAGFI